MKLEKKIVPKVWGREEWIWNEGYCGKLLVLNRGFQCSLHYHEKKDEVFYILRGEVLMEINGEREILKPGDAVHIKPHDLHRFTGLTGSQIIEFSSHHDDDDTFRKSTSGKANLKKAYDYDGVVTKGIEIEPGAPIITGRSFEEIDRISPEIFGSHPIYFNPVSIAEKNLAAEIDWKAKMIKLLGVEVFYEDQPEILVNLKRLCPKCQIRKV